MDTEKPVILIVDDQEVVCRLLEKFLFDLGYATITAMDGNEAIRLAKDHTPDLMLLDLQLPEKDGFEVCLHIKTQLWGEPIPIIVISSYDDDKHVKNALNNGANDYITKPIQWALLEHRIQFHIHSKQIFFAKQTAEISLQTKLDDDAQRLIEANQSLEERLKESTLELYQSEERFQLAVKGTGEGIWDWDIAKGEMYFSIRWKAMLGYQDHDVENTFHGWQRLIHPADLGRMLVIWTSYMEGELSEYKQEYRMKTKSGEYLWVESRGVCVFDVNGSPTRMAGSHTDISERKFQSRALEKKNRQLTIAYQNLKESQTKMLQQDKMASIGLLAAGIAHEINNPTGFLLSNFNSLQRYITKIKSYFNTQNELILKQQEEQAFPLFDELEKLKKNKRIKPVIEDLSEIVEDSLEGITRIKTIVHNLKSFSQMEPSEKTVLCNINDGIENTINIAWNELKYKAEIHKDYGELPQTKAHIQQLKQVFLNILVNAAHAIENRGDIFIKTWSENNNIMMSFKDTGSGIEEHKLDKIFNPFFSTKEVGKGSGLGLSISYDIIKNHDGEIIVESKLKQGTKFTITLPIVLDD
jgi:PAS domain S-box-containing protein